MIVLLAAGVLTMYAVLMVKPVAQVLVLIIGIVNMNVIPNISVKKSQ